jgi:hypothetical protein
MAEDIATGECTMIHARAFLMGFGVICTAEPTFWQRVAVVAAMSSFSSRSFLFVDVEGSGALDARVGALPMADFPHVGVADVEDLPVA